MLLLTVHVVTFGVPHIKTGSLHIERQHVPPFILVTQHRLCARRTHTAFWDTHNHKEPHLGSTVMHNVHPGRCEQTLLSRTCLHLCTLLQQIKAPCLGVATVTVKVYHWCRRNEFQVDTVNRWSRCCCGSRGCREGTAPSAPSAAAPQLLWCSPRRF